MLFKQTVETLLAKLYAHVEALEKHAAASEVKAARAAEEHMQHALQHAKASRIATKLKELLA
jgi:hypothetical protein